MGDPRQTQIKKGSADRDDEGGLIDLLLILVRRKGLLLGIFAAAMLTTAVLFFLVEPVYESRAVLAIGSLQNWSASEWGQKKQWLEDPNALGQRLRAQYDLHSSPMDLRHPDTLTLKVQSNSPLEAQKRLLQATNEILTKHGQILGRYLGKSKTHLTFIEAELADARETLKEISRRLNQEEGLGSTVTALLVVQKAQLVMTVRELGKESVALQLLTSEPATVPTRLLVSPTLSDIPAKPRLAFYLLLGTILGLISGILGVLFAEFVSKLRRGAG